MLKSVLVFIALNVLFVAFEVEAVHQTVQLMLANDDCVPKDVKNTIKQCWSKQGQQIWDSCSPSSSSSNNRGRGQMDVSYEAMETLSACIGSSLLNLTDLNAGEMVELGNTMLSKEALSPRIITTQFDYPMSPKIYFD